ncbi:TonB-dependent receptor [Marinobacter sp.]|uniref:TonB-dependent receptor n=1 Tax=Marinobacter sp. TaxID=50741 RepID=UPI002B26D978|nr:TonB-dependent receptor [Marinobacter sp.]
MKPILASLLALTAAMAQADDAQPFIVVESALVNAATDIDPRKAIGPVRVIERSGFENKTVSLADVLSDQAGVQIRQSGGLGSAASISVRGSTSRQVQVLLDGMLLNDPVTGGVDLSKLGLNNVRRVQVYPSGAPVQLPHGSIGGVVILETLGKDIEGTTSINMGAGSFDTYKIGAFNSGSRNNFYYWISADQQSSNNDFEYPNSSDWFNPNDGKTTKRRNASYEQDTVSSKLGWQVTETAQLDALLQYTHFDQGVPTIQNWRDNKASLTNETLRVQLHAQEKGWAKGALHSSHRLVIGDITENYDNRSGRVGLGVSDVKTDTRQLGFINTVTALLGNHTVTTSLDATHYNYQQDDRQNPDPKDERERLQLTGSLAHSWRSNDAAWRSQAALRLYHIKDESEESQGNGTAQETTASNSYTSWQLGLTRLIAENWNVSGNVARNVRVPTLQELYGQQGLFVGNPELEAEESVNYDLSLRTDQGWGHAEVTGYYRVLEPAVVATYDARGVGRYRNMEAKIYGTELDGTLRLTDHWSLYGNATLQESENTDASVRTRYQKRLPGIYHESYVIGTQLNFRPFEFDVSYQVDDELYYDSANVLAADTRQVVNARIEWHRIWPQQGMTEVQLEVRNITDEVYQDFNRFPGPGRAWFINIKHTL